MYTLYYSPGACSMAVHVALNELGAQYELKNAKQNNGDKTPELLKVNPRGAVPVLVDDGLVIREGAAILVYLLDKHQSPLLPREGKARAAALEWLMFANATLHPAYARVFFLMKNKADKALLQAACEHIATLWKEVDEKLAASHYIAGEECTMADILLTVIANWTPRMPHPIALGPNVKRLLKEITARPSYQKALVTEQVEYKAAA